MKDYLIIIRVGESEDKSVWGVLKQEGFVYIGNRTMVRSKKMNAIAVEKYKQYLEDLLINYDNTKIQVIEL